MNRLGVKLKLKGLSMAFLCLMTGGVEGNVVSYGVSVRTQTDAAILNEQVKPGKDNQNLVGGFGGDMARKAKDGRASISHDFSFLDEVNNINWGFTLTITSDQQKSICGTGSGFGIGDAQFEPGESVVFKLSELYATAGNPGETASVEDIRIDRVDMNGFTAGQSACSVAGGGMMVTNTSSGSVDLGNCADSSVLMTGLDLGGTDRQCRISNLGVQAEILIDGAPATSSTKSVKRRSKTEVTQEVITEPEPEITHQPLGLITG